MRLRGLVLVLVLALLAACSNSKSTSGYSPANAAGKGPRVSVAMVTHGQSFDPFWSLVRKGAEQAASDFNVSLTYQSPKTTNPQAQAELIDKAAAAKPNAMVVTIPEPVTLAPSIKRVTSSGTPVIVANVGDAVYRQVGALTFVGQPELVAGAEAGREMTSAGVRNALCVIHEERNTALADRCAGFTKQMTASGAKVRTIHVNGAQLHQAQVSIEQALRSDPTVNGVLATGIISFNATGGALQVLNAFGKVKLGSFDVSTSGLKALQNGQALFIIDQQPFLEGYDSVQIAAFQVRYGQHPFNPTYTGPSLVTKQNAAKVQQLYKNTGIPLFAGGYPQ